MAVGDHGLSDADLALLTDEERAAFEDDDAAGDPPEAETEGAVAALDSAETSTSPGDLESEGEVSAESGVPGDTDDVELEEEGETSAMAGDQKTVEPFVPQYQAEAVEGYQEKMTDIDSRRAALMTDLMDGELEQEDYAKQLTALDAERDALRDANVKASISQEQQAQVMQQRWQWEIDNFLADSHANSGIDYKGNQMLFGALDVAVKNLANDPENAERDARWFLHEGHKQVVDTFKLAQPVADTKRSKAATGVKASAAIPPTLGGLPAAADNGTGEDRFAHLDKLEGIEYEEALAKLSPADSEAYLNG